MSKDQVVVSRKKKKKIKVFPIVNVILFLLISLIILIPIWKVIVDSFDKVAGYGMRFWPQTFSLGGYQQIASRAVLYKPFGISCLVTVIGTFLGLLLATLGAYVLIQWDMPGRNFFAYMLLFTMIFDGGMIPKYLVMKDLHLLNTLWAVILPLAINVYNLVLMRNFFEGIPDSLFEAASIDGCSPMGTFFKIVLPLSKAALASIGLMFAVQFWNDYTNFKIYINVNSLFNFQIRLRAMVMDNDIPNNGDGVDPNTVSNAAVIVAILPFAIIYPFCQKYFVKGVNVGAVKE
jgi:putative aldouronate transport system permease protein